MLTVQVKVSKKGGIVVISSTGEVHPCLVPEDLWDTMLELVEDPPTGVEAPVPGALFVQVKVRRDTIIIIDPLAEIHPCQDGHDLWDTLADLIENDEMPQVVSSALVQQKRQEIVEHEDVQVIHGGAPSDGRRQMHADEVRDVIEEMVGDSAAALGSALFTKLRGMSHRGAVPKPGSRRPRRRVKRGDII